MNEPERTAVEQVIDKVGSLSRLEAERIAAALAIAKTDPQFERCRFAIEVGVRLDCGACRRRCSPHGARGPSRRTLPVPNVGRDPRRAPWSAAVPCAPGPQREVEIPGGQRVGNHERGRRVAHGGRRAGLSLVAPEVE